MAIETCYGDWKIANIEDYMSKLKWLVNTNDKQLIIICMGENMCTTVHGMCVLCVQEA